MLLDAAGAQENGPEKEDDPITLEMISLSLAPAYLRALVSITPTTTKRSSSRH